MESGTFSKRIGSGQTGTQEGLLTAKGNEYRILRANTLDITASAATADTFVVPNNRTFKLTQMSIRETTAVVNNGSVTGVVKVGYIPVGTATIQDISGLTVNVTTAAGGLSGATTQTTDFVLSTPQTLPGGTAVVLRHVQATGGSAAGVMHVSVFATESDNNV